MYHLSGELITPRSLQVHGRVIDLPFAAVLHCLTPGGVGCDRFRITWAIFRRQFLDWSRRRRESFIIGNIHGDAVGADLSAKPAPPPPGCCCCCCRRAVTIGDDSPRRCSRDVLVSFVDLPFETSRHDLRRM